MKFAFEQILSIVKESYQEPEWEDRTNAPGTLREFNGAPTDEWQRRK